MHGDTVAACQQYVTVSRELYRFSPTTNCQYGKYPRSDEGSKLAIFFLVFGDNKQIDSEDDFRRQFRD